MTLRFRKTLINFEFKKRVIIIPMIRLYFFIEHRIHLLKFLYIYSRVDALIYILASAICQMLITNSLKLYL